MKLLRREVSLRSWRVFWSPLLVLLVLAIGLLLVVGCGGSGGGGGQESGGTQTTTAAAGQEGSEGSGGGGGGTLTVLAAASLTDAFNELGKTFEQENPGSSVKFSYGGSSQLLTQIEQGAPADVFASADEAKMNTAVKDGFANDPATFVRNRPVIIVPKDNPAGIQGLEDLAKPGTKLVLAQDGVPIAEYAKQILKNADSEYGSDFDQRVSQNVVSRESDVRAAANRVALGEADGTFVYVTDVTSSIQDKVEVIEVPQQLNVIATYPIATLKESQNPELAQKWVDLVLSSEGQGVLKKYAFEPAASGGGS